MDQLTLGIDIGGTNTALGLVSPDGNIVARGKVPTAISDDVNVYVEHLYLEAKRLCESTGTSFSAVGVGAPCINQSTGNIEGATNLPWGSHVAIKSLLESQFNMDVYAANDANAAAAGEMVYGSMRGISNFIMLTLGTGVGAGVVCDGHLLGGKNGFAGELGHYTVAGGEGRKCGCGRYDCLQTYASASGVVDTLKRLIRQNNDTESPLVDKLATVTPHDIYLQAVEGDPIALKTFEFTGEILGKAAANFATFSSPEAFVLFGGVAGASEFIFPAMRRALDDNLLHIYNNQIKLFKSSLSGADAALLGAAALGHAMNPNR